MTTTLVQEPLAVQASFSADPYASYREWREAGPLHWSDQFFGGAWVLTRHADVEAALRDPRLSAQRTGGWVTQAQSQRGDMGAFQRFFARALLFLDPPDHTRLRALMQPSFRPEALARLREHIASTTATLLDAVQNESTFDFIDRVARQLPVRVICRVMGIDNADLDQVTRWSTDLAPFIGDACPNPEQARRAQAGLLGMVRYFEGVLESKRSSGGDDLISVLLRARERGDIRDDAELLAQCAMTLFAGHETTRNLLGNGLLALLQHPAQWQQLRQQPQKVSNAVREMLRYDSPVQYTGRRVTCDMELHGQALQRGDLVMVLIGSANRDPRRHHQPDHFDIDRPDPGALAFGSGIHVCIGAAMTRLEAEIVFSQLIDRASHWQLAQQRLEWKPQPLYRSLQRLIIQAD